ncbi:MAG: glycosyltransferase [Methanosphaera sp.]|nr:glycosyltransferase [Methanosphaera sp.]
MKIPQQIRESQEFDKLRLIRNNVIDSKNLLKDKLSNKIKEIRRPKRVLSSEDMIELANVIEDIDLDSIPVFDENAPLVSIVIVNRDGLGHLKRLFNAMDAIIDYYPNFEVIVVDNASNDASVDFVNSLNNLNITCIQNDVNESFSHANNQALEVAGGEYLLFLNNDVEPLNGFLNFMMDSMLSDENVGAVGARLFYPDCSGNRINHEKSFSIQHNGIMFKESEGFIRPFNRENGVEVYDSTGDVFSVAGVTAACLLVSHDDFESVGGFDESYVYGYEDVDFCLKLVRNGLDILCDGRARLYHYEFGTQQTDSNREVRDRRLNNRRVFVERWNSWLRKKLFDDKLNGKRIFSDSPLTVAFVVTEDGEDATAGDYFTALGLAGRFEQFGWTVKFLPQRGRRSWYYVDDDVDVLISLLDRYDLSKVRCANSMLVKVAWLRNWFERWVSMPYFMMYDIVLCSSSLACDFVSQHTGMEAFLFPLATDTSMFNGDVSVVDDFKCDYCFTGSYWNADREIVDCLNPDDDEYTFKLYGANWEKVSSLSKYSSGFVSYGDLPGVYASCRVVLDDANHVTRGFGSVNSRVFDAISCGRLVFTNGSKGNMEVFDGKLPEYHSQQELQEQLTHYLENKNEYDQKVQQLQEIVLNNHTYSHRANRFKQILTEYYDKYKIAIKIPAPSWNEAHKWGDFYLAEGLMKEFIKRGYAVKLQVLPQWGDDTDSICDAIIVLRGLSRYKTKLAHLNIMWNISHPDLVGLNEYCSYDYVFIASKKWAEKISSKIDTPVECMWQCTDTNRFYPDYNEDYKHELLFVGNSRKVYRKIIKDLLPTEHDLAVYGSDWNKLINKKYIQADHIDNKQLRYAYSSCDILLNDHWDDMREKGFISNRIFDALACGACVISDDIDGLDELFENRVLTYTSPEQLKELIDENLGHSREYDVSIISQHTYSERVNQFIKLFK